MASDVEEQDFAFSDLHRQGDALAVGKADGLHSLEFAAEGVKAQAWLEGIGLQTL